MLVRARATRSRPMTDFNDSARENYSVQDYSSSEGIEGVEVVELKRFNDDGGAMTELGRFDAGMPSTDNDDIIFIT